MGRGIPLQLTRKSIDRPKKEVMAKPKLLGPGGKLQHREFAVGSRIRLLSPASLGTLRYVGPLHVAVGTWYGVELDNPGILSNFDLLGGLLTLLVGKSDGLVQGVRYFQTESKRALFVKQDRIHLA